jgi:tetratricopeptide (TPR) repeat protein
MILKSLMPSVLCVAVLAGCASTAQGPAAKPATIGPALLEADAAVKAGQNDRAIAILKGAASAFPADKTPWVQMAQLRFDNKNYGEAIVNGLEAIERDPDDMLAYSLVAVSGLRVSSKALADLTQKNNISGTVRSEAHDLAKLLRASLGEEVLVPVKPAVARPARAAKPAPQSAGKPAPCSGPFCSFN